MRGAKGFSLLLGLVLIIGTLAAFSPVQAQVDPSPRDPQAPVALPRFAGSLADFKQVDFLCDSDTSGDYAAESICTVARNTTRAGAVESNMYFGEDPSRSKDDGLILYVRVTSSGTVPRAVSALVQASRYYEQAFDKAASYDTPAAWPRRGKLVFYEEIVTGVGQGDSLENGMRVGVRRLIQGLFARLRDEQQSAR